MVLLACWSLFFLITCVLDCLRDTRPFGNSFLQVHLIKWAGWYPALAVLWYEHIYLPHGWLMAAAVAIACSAVWRLTQGLTQPPHWADEYLKANGEAPQKGSTGL